MTGVVKILEPVGVLDGATINELKHQVTDLVQQGTDICLLDMKGVTFMNSSAIGVFISISKMVHAKEKRLYLCGLSDQVKMLFELTKMDRIFQVFSDRVEFEIKVPSQLLNIHV